MKKTILLTGAFGSVGLETLKQLTSNIDKYDIRVIDLKNRKNTLLSKKFKNKISIYWEDLSCGSDYKHILTGVDFVIHLAAVIPPLADRNTTLAKRVNFDGTVHLVEQIKKYARNAFFLYSSSISVYGDRVSSPFISVSDSLSPSEGDYYAQTKIMAEEYIRASQIRYSIFRFSAIMSPQAKLDPLFFHMPLNTSMEIATTRDTAFALVNAIYHQEELINQTFNLSGGVSCRIVYKDFLSNAFKLSKLGSFNLPQLAFAKKNFHCGFYSDASILNDILHFQRDSLDDYFTMYRKAISKFQLFFTTMFRKLIKKQLLKKSDPLLSIKHGNSLLQRRFFGYEI